MLTLRNINKSFGEKKVLKNVSLDIPTGKTTVIIGPSGSGKSTLLRSINMLNMPEEGSMEFEGKKVTFGEELTKEDEQAFRNFTGMVFQDYNLFPHKTILENITLAPVLVNGVNEEQAIEHAEYLLSQVGLSDKKDDYPSQLSGGQQQRVAIARTLAAEPKILLFDEPTSALDPEIELEILELISRITKDKYTNVLVTHNMKFAKEISDVVVFMDNGELVEVGTYEELENSSNDRVVKFLNIFA